MADLDNIKNYQIAQREGGRALELTRESGLVSCLGFDLKRGRFVEISVMRDGDSDAFMERAEVLLNCKHPQIANVVDCGSEGDKWFCVSDFADGEDILAYAARVQSTPFEDAMNWMIQFAEGAQALQSRGLNVNLNSSRLCLTNSDSVRLVIPASGVTNGPAESDLGSQVHDLLKALTNYQRPEEPSVCPPEVEQVGPTLRGVRRASEIIVQLRGLGVEWNQDSVPESLRPRLFLEREMFHRVRPEHVLPKNLRRIRRAGQGPAYESVLEEPSTAELTRVLVLPPERMVPKSALAILESSPCPHQLCVRDYWEHEDFRLLGEDFVPGFSVDEWVIRCPHRNVEDIVILLERIEEALSQLTEAGRLPDKLHPADVIIEFEQLGGHGLSSLAGSVSIPNWPPFHLRIRSHMTTRALTELQESVIPDGSEDLIAKAEQGQPLSVAAVFSWYFHLRGGGLSYAADELIKGLRGTLSPDPDGSVDPDPENSGSGNRSSFQEPISYEDGSAEDKAEDFPVVSPIAAAFGYSEDNEKGSDEFETNPIARQIVPNEPLHQAIDFSRLGKNQQENEVYPGKRSGKNFFVTLLIFLIAIGIAVLWAHLTGKAFWLQ